MIHSRFTLVSQMMTVSKFSRSSSLRAAVPDVDVERLEGLSFGRLLDVARVFPPEKDSSPRLGLDVVQVGASRTLHLLVDVERRRRLVYANEDLCVHKTLRMRRTQEELLSCLVNVLRSNECLTVGRRVGVSRRSHPRLLSEHPGVLSAL